MDMVLAKESRVNRDLEQEPVKLVLEGTVLRADGTTLGADNAVGLCHMMALMELSGSSLQQDVRHPCPGSSSFSDKGSPAVSDSNPPTASLLRHPPLELLFTVEEESGLSGIRKADLSGIRSRLDRKS